MDHEAELDERRPLHRLLVRELPSSPPCALHYRSLFTLSLAVLATSLRYQVFCTSGDISRIGVSANQLSGSVPSEIGDLTGTTYLAMYVDSRMRIAFLLQEERCCSLFVCFQVHEYADWLFPERDRPPHENVHLLQPGGKLHFRFTAFGSWGDDWVIELLHAR